MLLKACVFSLRDELFLNFILYPHRFEFDVIDGWNPEDSTSTTPTHIYYVEMFLPMATTFGYMQMVDFMGQLVPDMYMGSSSGASIEYVRKPLPTDQPTTSGNLATT